MPKFTLINTGYSSLGIQVCYGDGEVTSDLKDVVWEMAVKRHDNENPNISLVKVEEVVLDKPLFTREEMIEYAKDLGYEDIAEVEKILQAIPGYIKPKEDDIITPLLSGRPVGRDCPKCSSPLYWLEVPVVDKDGIEGFTEKPGCYHCQYHE